MRNKLLLQQNMWKQILLQIQSCDMRSLKNNDLKKRHSKAELCHTGSATEQNGAEQRRLPFAHQDCDTVPGYCAFESTWDIKQ